jgi:hypothetical protein
MKVWVIIGLRATHPTILGEQLPGYFGEAMSTHRNGFQLPGDDSFFAWFTNPHHAMRFEREGDADHLVALLVADKNFGWFGPITVLPVYFP